MRAGRRIFGCWLTAALSAAVAAGGASATTPQVRAAQTCYPGKYLSGRLTARSASCATARRVAYGYFTHTRPGKHVGPAKVDGFHCLGSYRHKAFHITCTRRLARVRFTGVGV